MTANREQMNEKRNLLKCESCSKILLKLAKIMIGREKNYPCSSATAES